MNCRYVAEPDFVDAGQPDQHARPAGEVDQHDRVAGLRIRMIGPLDDPRQRERAGLVTGFDQLDDLPMSNPQRKAIGCIES